MAVPIVPRVTAFTLAKASEINTIIDQLEALIEFQGLTAGSTELKVSAEFQDGDVPGFADLTGAPSDTFTITPLEWGIVGTLNTGDSVEVVRRDGSGAIYMGGGPGVGTEVGAKVIDGSTGLVGFFEFPALTTPIVVDQNLTVSLPIQAFLADVPIDAIRRDYDSLIAGIKELFVSVNSATNGVQFLSEKGAINGYAPLDGSTKIPLTHMQSVIASGDLTNDGALEKVANKGVLNGYCELDGATKVPAANISEVLDTSDLADLEGSVNSVNGVPKIAANIITGGPQLPFSVELPAPLVHVNAGNAFVTVTHNLGYNPIVQFKDAGSGKVYTPVDVKTATAPEVIHTNSQEFTCEWTGPITGDVIFR